MHLLTKKSNTSVVNSFSDSRYTTFEQMLIAHFTTCSSFETKPMRTMPRKRNSATMFSAYRYRSSISFSTGE